MKNEIEQALKPLVGLRMWGPARCVNMLSLQFGGPRLAPTKRDPERLAGEFAIHVSSCAWRLTAGDRLVVGSNDLGSPSDPGQDLPAFDCSKVGATWWDVCINAFFEERTATLPIVREVSADALGGFRLTCSDAVVFEVFVTCTSTKEGGVELWRLLSPGTVSPHFVVMTSGVVDGG